MFRRTICSIGLIAAFSLTTIAWDQTPVAEVQQVNKFPVKDLLPKEETGALQFLNQHPEYDGRGVIVAIFDSGVDPAAPGLQTTTDGKPKILDVIDASGSGDVDMSTVQEAVDGQLTGLTGRSLKINPEWNNPTGKFHLGIKSSADLLPPELMPRLNRERKRAFELRQRALEKELRQQNPANGHEGLSKEEYEAREEQLKAAWNSFEDPGVMYDCVVFHDGENWRAVVDTDEDGDLANEKALANYRLEREYAQFDHLSQLNFAVNIFDEGKLLSIVVPNNAHGTHVAGIVAAHHEDDPAKNGVAPGAQIISVMIGDTRLQGMETGVAMIRGLQAVLDHNCDMINMSYGEPSSVPDHGRVAELFNDLVREKNVVFVSSAGNAGPALSTVGAAGGSNSAVLGIGAYISPAMMEAEYSLSPTETHQAFTWTSRGPTTDGAWGVDLFAPGAAITTVPTYLLQPSKLMNGTSMASPNACGNIALMISAFKQQGIAYNSNSLRRSLQATAKTIETADKFAQGPGLVQVDKAYDHFIQHKDLPGQGVEITAAIQDRQNARGIYLREPGETNRVHDLRAIIAPKFPPATDPVDRLNYEQTILLQCDADWVQVGQYLQLTSTGAPVPISVDAKKLSPGIHATEIVGVNSSSPEAGALFRIPVIVTKADWVKNSEWSHAIELEAGQVSRNLIAVPRGAQTAQVEVIRSEGEGSRFFFIHTVQLVPGRNFEHLENNARATLFGKERWETSIPVQEGRTLELCISQFWSSLGHTKLDLKITFSGLSPSHKELALPGDRGSVAVDVLSRLKLENCAPQAKLDTWERILLPHSSKTTLLTSERDSLWDDRQSSQMILEYTLEQPQQGSVALICPLFDRLLYESPVGSFRILIFDENKQLIAAEDVFSEDHRLNTANIPLKQGIYQIRLEMQDLDPAMLKKFEGLALVAVQPLSKAINLPIDRNRMTSVAEKNQFGSQKLEWGQQVPLYIRFPSTAQIPAEVKAGDRLTGSLKLTADQAASIPVSFVYPGKGESASKSSVSNDNVDLTKAQTEFLLKTLKTLKWPKHQEEINLILNEIEKLDTGNREALVAKLHLLDANDRQNHLTEIVSTADSIIQKIDETALRIHFGTRQTLKTDEQKKANKQKEAEKTDLIDALARKARALGDLEKADANSDTQQFDQVYDQLASWVDPTAKEYVLLQVHQLQRKGEPGLALKALNKAYSSNSGDRDIQNLRVKLYEELGWDLWKNNQQTWLLRRFPENFVPF